MERKKNKPSDSRKAGNYYIEGRIKREQPECESEKLKLAAYVFDKAGMLLGNADLDNKDNYNVSVRLSKPTDVELIIGPVGNAKQIRHSNAYSKKFSAKEWKGEGVEYKLNYDTILPLDVWHPWLPQRICISGHVRKVSQQDDVTDICPVPYVKVEIFDVDREACWWPWLRKWWKLILDRTVVRIPELLQEPPFPPQPFPGPDPVPGVDLGNVQSLSETIGKSTLRRISSNTQPESSAALMRVGEANMIDTNIASRMDKLTLTSKIAPWHIFNRCFYSKALVCETTTDCSGYFKCCFNWWPFHTRQGRLRFDKRPDIIIKVTQVINGVSSVIYMDPYTSTRWNVNNAHIDLFLDNEEVVCGSSYCYEPPTGSPVFFTRIGDDEVYKISQTSGLYNDITYSNVAYGSTLNIYGQFGDDLTRSDPALGDPPPYFYYRLSYAKQGSSDNDFKLIDVNLNDTRVDKGTYVAQNHKLGPYTVSGVPSLYEIRNFNDYYWYNPDWIGKWHSWLAEEDTGTYILRLEIYDKNGIKQNTVSGTVDYMNGADVGNGIPPDPMPPMVDHCDLVITLDNKAPVAELEVPIVANECGVISWTDVPPLDFLVNASQENNRLREWKLWYTKGVGSETLLEKSVFSSNSIGNVTNLAVSGAPLLVGLNGTCAFALRLRAKAHIRNGRHFIYYDQDIDAIAIEKCTPCPSSS